MKKNPKTERNKLTAEELRRARMGRHERAMDDIRRAPSSPSPLAVGKRVRVEMPEHYRIGTVLWFSDLEIVIREATGLRPISINRRQVFVVVEVDT